MDQKMITLATDMQFSKERLEEIFAVPKTKQLYEQFIKQERNEMQIKELTQRLENVYEREDADADVAEVINIRLKTCILAHSLESVINGKSLNQAIKADLKEQLKEETVIKEVAGSISELEGFHAMSQLLSGLIGNMLS